MRKRVTALLIAGLAVVAVGSTASVATAKHGADDPAGHVRHANGKDDAKSKSKSKSKGKDDAPGHVRHGHGADDGPNHH